MAETDIAIVTGASRGIGAAIAIQLAQRGWMVACLSRSGEAPARSDPSLSPRFVTCACDVTDEAVVRNTLAALAGRGFRLKALVNNAGIHQEGRSESFATADFEKVLATNATALFALCREAYPQLCAGGGGIIVNIGSFYDKLGVKRNAAYCASKAAVAAITRCLAVEWAKAGIRVIDVAPGFVMTDLNRAEFAEGRPLRAFLEKRIPGGSATTPDTIGKLVAALVTEDIPFLTGETIYIDGGQGLAL